jgi:hypothetical protein
VPDCHHALVVDALGFGVSDKCGEGLQFVKHAATKPDSKPGLPRHADDVVPDHWTPPGNQPAKAITPTTIAPISHAIHTIRS